MSVTSGPLNILKECNAAPFLFVGSGFSRRYIGLETWSDLLARFCTHINEFGYYFSSANGDLPRTAALIAHDFNEIWWTHPDFEESKKEYGGEVRDQSSALKYEISKYLKNLSLEYKDAKYAGEIDALSKVNVDGIITTNWDLFLEELFPDYKVFIGQEELLFSNPQSVAEIYKIHGCASRPSSLVLTDNDYANFQGKNPYLAAKLITIFVEHPVIFLGYSINDPHIQAIIGSIADCVGGDKMRQFENNLIFVERQLIGQDEGIEGATLTLGKNKVRVTLMRTDDFTKIYAAVEAIKRKIPARVLRYCKEQMYELVKSSDPETKLAVRDLDEIAAKDDIEFVVGVGVAAQFKEHAEKIEERQKDALTKRGYAGITVDDVFLDVIKDECQYDAVEILRSTYPFFRSLSNKYIPVFRYLQMAGISDWGAMDDASLTAARIFARRLVERGFMTDIYRTQYERGFKGLTTQEIIEKTTAEKAVLMIPFQPRSNIDLDAVRNFLLNNSEKLVEGMYKSYFRKLACMYDTYAYGFQ